MQCIQVFTYCQRVRHAETPQCSQTVFSLLLFPYYWATSNIVAISRESRVESSRVESAYRCLLRACVRVARTVSRRPKRNSLLHPTIGRAARLHWRLPSIAAAFIAAYLLCSCCSREHATTNIIIKRPAAVNFIRYLPSSTLQLLLFLFVFLASTVIKSRFQMPW